MEVQREMAEEQGSPVRDAGWYPDPERKHTLRYWDGDAWTDDRAPDVPGNRTAEVPEPEAVRAVTTSWTTDEGGLTAQGRYALGVVLAGIGALIAVFGVFLPLADTESSLHIAKNSLIQHWEGPVIIAVAIGGFIAALSPKTRPLSFIAGGALVLVAVLAGTDLPIAYRNELSRVAAGDVSPGAGVWTVGAGGAILALSALFGDWSALSGGDHPPSGSTKRGRRLEEIMSGTTIEEPAAEAEADTETAAPSQGGAKSSRWQRYEELMSGRRSSDSEER